MAKSNTEVAERPSTAVGQVYDYGGDAGAGFEGTKGSDLSIPFLQVLQANSPQVEDQKPEGAAAGMLYNTVTGELTKGEVVFLPVHKQDSYVEWVPRDSGGGFVGLHAPDSAEVKAAIAANGGDRFKKLVTGKGNDLIETHYMYGLLLDETGTQTQGFAVLAFASTKIKPYRDWTTAMYMVKGRPPLFAFRAKIATVKQKNEKGSYFNYHISPFGNTWVEGLINPQTEAALLQEARDFKKLVESGVARANFESQGGNETPATDETKPPF
jgi:hypothetical protein